MSVSKQVDRKRLALVRKLNYASSSGGVGMNCHVGVLPQRLDQNCPWQICESFVPWALGSVMLNYVPWQYSLDSDNFCTHSHMTVPMGFCVVPVSLILPMGWNVLWMCLGERKLFRNTVYWNHLYMQYIDFIMSLTNYQSGNDNEWVIIITLSHILITISVWDNVHNIKLPLIHSGIEYDVGYVR
jgi:hypothetical protein